jgi:hypothetical protein
MNEASKAILRWLLLRENQPRNEIERFLAALERGVAKQESDSIEMMRNLMAAARLAAKGTDAQTDIESLVVLHEKLVLIDLEEKAATAIGNVALILKDPPRSALEARIKSNLIAKTLAPLDGR